MPALVGPVSIRGDATPSNRVDPTNPGLGLGNCVVVPLGPGVRTVWIYLKPDVEQLGQRSPNKVPWGLTATLRLIEVNGQNLFNSVDAVRWGLRPDRITIPPLRSMAACVAACYLPTVPVFDYLDLCFIQHADPDARATVYAYGGDVVGQPACGLFALPFGATPAYPPTD
jgi:hypothetical protein